MLLHSSHPSFRAWNEGDASPVLRTSVGLLRKGTIMANEQGKNPTTGQESDISKSQATQEPTGQQSQQPESGEQRQQSEFGQERPAGQPDEGLEGGTATRQDTDIEGASQTKDKGEAESGFVGSQSESDRSSELVEDDDFAKGGQGAPEGK
jgi:hypothetical protein